MDPFKGGGWSNQKIKALKRYLEAYMTIMKGKPNVSSPFKKVYFDAFCGSGARLVSELPLFDGTELISITENSPRAALDVNPQFDQYVFCDIKPNYVKKLKTSLLGDEYDLSTSRFIVGEANAEIASFCRSTNWKETRCVMFLDPLGTSVNWQTLEIIAKTGAIDLWYLFPSGLGPVRMTPRSGNVPDKWAQKLTTLWGDDSWDEVSYSVESVDDLFGDHEQKKTKTGRAIDFEFAFIEKLKTIFAAVSPSALRLYNSKGSHMFSLLFACSNAKPVAFGPALKIAKHIIEMQKR